MSSFRSWEYAQHLEAEFRYDARHRRALRAYQLEAKAALLRTTTALGQPGLLHVATGGGKTLIANEVLVDWIGQSGGPVLWVTKDWRLLVQAAGDLCRRHPRFRPTGTATGLPATVRRLGGDNAELAPLPELSSAADPTLVVYTTLHTLQRRIVDRALPRGFRPTLVIWDECHWGEHGEVGRALLKWRKTRQLPLLGLTATPRQHSAFAVVYRKDFATLVEEGYLARPRICDPVRTEVSWSPLRSNADSDFQQDSLRELGDNRKRNQLIVDHYAGNAATYGKTIVFACTIEHADKLARLFHSRHGIAARAVHSEWHASSNDEALRLFRSGEVQVLINVAMLTHGVDVPDARTVFLCRPTLSPTLFSQMIGRASRRHDESGKTEFFVVEFTDNILRFGDQLVRARDFFDIDAAPSRPRPVSRPSPKVRVHAFDPGGEPTWMLDNPTVPEAMRGLWYRQGQTFGFEFELTADGFSPEMSKARWSVTADALRTRLAQALPDRVATRPFQHPGDPERVHDVWNVVWDSSAGWEVTSRILRDKEGFAEVVTACEALDEAASALGLKVNYRTGLHVHIGWRGGSPTDIRRAILLARLFEPALGTLVSPSRLARFEGNRYEVVNPNIYCQPVAHAFPAARVQHARTYADIWSLCATHSARYVTFNIKPLETIQTVEVRLHNGTLEARKALLWLSLWMQILWAATERKNVEIPPVGDRDVIQPDGDILRLVKEYLPTVQQERFLQRLHERRSEILELWRQHPDLGPWLPYAERWVEPVGLDAN